MKKDTAKTQRTMRGLKNTAGKGWKLALLIFFALVFTMPFYWSVLTSLRPNDEIFSAGINLLPTSVTFEHYEKAFKAIPFLLYSLNTLLITVMIIATNLLFCSLAGYAFAKLTFHGKKLIYRLMLLSVMVPGTVLMIPQFLILARFPLVGGNNLFGQGGYGFSGNLLGVVLPTAVSVFNILFMRSFYLTLPDEIGEAARIDGAGEFRTFWQIYAPLSKPALATLTVFCFQSGWNSFVWPSVILRNGDFKVLTQGLQAFSFNNNIDYGPMMAATVCATLPVIIVFICAQKYFIKGIAFSGSKT
ncbi:MAG: carbohydrate ABC transporter permease [Oscillospiraceae bacterium]|nr:carbohydrate ABC transporter permease [Oscillospiraceae bacterium]